MMGTWRGAELAAFSVLDVEARRLVLESIAGSVSDEEEGDEGSAGLAAALAAEAERLQQLASARARQQAAARVEDGRADDFGDAASDGVSSSCASSRDSSSDDSREAEDSMELLQAAATSLAPMTSPADQPDSQTHAAENAETSLGLPGARSATAAELDDAGNEEHIDWEQRDPEAVAACVAASGDWSRIVRHAPRADGMCRLHHCWLRVCVLTLAVIGPTCSEAMSVTTLLLSLTITLTSTLGSAPPLTRAFFYLNPSLHHPGGAQDATACFCSDANKRAALLLRRLLSEGLPTCHAGHPERSPGTWCSSSAAERRATQPARSAARCWNTSWPSGTCGGGTACPAIGWPGRATGATCGPRSTRNRVGSRLNMDSGGCQ